MRQNQQAGVVVDPPLRMKTLRRFPYGVVFVAQDELNWVLAVHHDRQDSGDWIDRLEDVSTDLT